jgi:hypothetical protein
MIDEGIAQLHDPCNRTLMTKTKTQWYDPPMYQEPCELVPINQVKPMQFLNDSTFGNQFAPEVLLSFHGQQQNDEVVAATEEIPEVRGQPLYVDNRSAVLFLILLGLITADIL